MNDKPPTDKLDRDKLHASSVWEPSNRKPSRRLVLRLATNALSNRKPGAKHLLFRQVLFSVGISTSMHLLLHLTQFRMTKVRCRQFLRRHLLEGRERGED
jgi:hypothetical protein